MIIVKPEDVIMRHQEGQPIPWRSCSDQTIEQVAIWADRYDGPLLRKVRAAARRRHAVRDELLDHLADTCDNDGMPTPTSPNEFHHGADNERGDFDADVDNAAEQADHDTEGTEARRAAYWAQIDAGPTHRQIRHNASACGAPYAHDWTIRDEQVTCISCLKIMDLDQQAADAEVAEAEAVALAAMDFARQVVAGCEDNLHALETLSNHHADEYVRDLCAARIEEIRHAATAPTGNDPYETVSRASLNGVTTQMRLDAAKDGVTYDEATNAWMPIVPHLPEHVAAACVTAIDQAQRDGRYAEHGISVVDLIGDVAEIVRNVDLMDDYAEAIEIHLTAILARQVANGMVGLIICDEEHNTEHGGKPYEARSFSALHAECDANEYIIEAFIEMGIWEGYEDQRQLDIANVASSLVCWWLASRPEPRVMFPGQITDLIIDFAQTVEDEGTLGFVLSSETEEVAYLVTDLADSHGWPYTPADFDAIHAATKTWLARHAVPASCSYCGGDLTANPDHCSLVADADGQLTCTTATLTTGA